jgi:hypothetical protein
MGVSLGSHDRGVHEPFGELVHIRLSLAYLGWPLLGLARLLAGCHAPQISMGRKPEQRLFQTEALPIFRSGPGVWS